MASHAYPSKRPFQKKYSEHNGRAKWQKTKHAPSQQPQLTIQPGVPLIRILCPTEKCGNVIGKGGSIIAKIRQENGVKIRVDEAVPGCDERVIVITTADKDKEASHEQGKENDGGTAVSADGEHEKEKDHSKEEKDDSDNAHGKEEQDDAERDDSKEENDDSSVAKTTKLEPERVIPSAMNAVLHVFDRIFITESENGTGDASGQKTPVSFRLLVLDSQVGSLLGIRGSVIKQMSADSGCEIRVSKENLPLCALLKDELCQINGELDSVRKGLNAVAQVLFTHPPRESDVVPVVHPSGSSSRTFNPSDGLPPGMPPNFHLPFQGPSHARGPFDTIDHRPNVAPFSTFPDQRSNIPPFSAFPDALMHGNASVPPEPLTFRLLCSSDKVGSIIGKGGNSIKTIQKDTGCEIKILETIPKSDDHIIIISGPAHPGDGISPAQNAILHVQRKITPPTSNKEGPAISRLIVSPNQVGCLLGKGGSIIAEMRKLSKAHIIVLSKDKIPRGVQEIDEVVQITGDSEAIQEALMQITARLRNNLFRDRMASMGPSMQPPFGLLDPQFGAFPGSHESTSPRIYPNASQFHKDFMGRPLDEMSAPWTTKGMQDVGDPMSISGIPGMAHRGMGGFSGPVHSSRPIITGNIMVPRLVIPALCGHDGGCLNMIREFSGAKITIDEPLADSMDTPVMISGTPDQMHAARSLVQAFVLSEPPAP
ncbi:KH domain-containing protein HEN4-like isoform X1 [Triticum dicoccoides]|uniref:KH domain-containing protein HEN4-like isoform X1 n=1 Tax=Triticum dicoccoides TaxID=85692 RepID=UPI00188EF1FC|nr:KH domain-containing protein HEN4-like isoform X1 [Triticum dicoccoides]XP_037412378.1 KH domain-containing protein HEN4-like isoform X1 [Triticum dicoccoides]XP_037412379.1 KH domain-containing protein HEN4-like isoform X1 [Triticum dicoccoides]XP_037412380.1 KH domain-containing protein HEN4-like isoform X1 [Triticum dicoccoides]XP_037412381.1 KH domain-containing protein HEN4-like isoform X1 [Triticum dicoccoides]